MGKYYITGDTHGDFWKIEQLAKRNHLTEEDVIIILGDVGFNYSGYIWDSLRKDEVSKTIPCTFFCIHGNHEMRPDGITGYTLKEWHEGKVWVDPQYPRLLFAKDGEVFDLNGKKTLVIGGAYSVDKLRRVAMGYRWFEDEQPSEQIKQYVVEQLDKVSWKVDVVLSHTCPYTYVPSEAFISGIDPLTVDFTTELFLEKIEKRLDYQRWYCGHYHIEKRVDMDKLQFLYEKIQEF